MGVPNIPHRSDRYRLSRRGNRKEYWIVVVILVALGLTLQVVAPAMSLAGAAVMIFFQVRRLHDFGRTGWWIAASLALQVIAAFALSALHISEDMLAIPVGVITMIPIAIIGAIPGDPLDNRFGPPSGRRPIAETFS